MKIYFSSLETLNFRSIPDNKKITLTKNTKITGPNATGKTSIQMAIISGLTGYSLDGKNNIEQYKKDKEKPLSIKIGITIENKTKNKKCQITLELKKQKKVFFFNNKQISQKELMAKFKIGDLKSLTSSLSPNFIMGLPESDLLELISRISDKEKQKLAKEILTATQLKKIDALDLDNSLKNIKRERIDTQKHLNEITESIAYNMGQIKAISDIEPNQSTYSKTEHNKTKREMEVAQKIELASKHAVNELQKIEETEAEELRKTSFQKTEKSQSTTLIQKMKKRLTELKAEKTKNSKIEKPTIPPEIRNQMKRWELARTKITEINNNAKQLQEQIKKLTPMSTTEIKTNMAIKQEMKNKKDEIIIKQAGKIKILKDKIKNQTIVELQKKLHNFELSENKERNISVTLIERKIKADNTKKNNINKKLGALSDIETKIKELPKNQLKKRATEISKMFPKQANIKIITEENEKPCFKILKNEHSFNWLSSSEKIKISSYLSKYIGIRSKTPFNSIFIDNVEMLSNEVRTELAEQIITARVTNDKTLKINGKDI